MNKTKWPRILFIYLYRLCTKTGHRVHMRSKQKTVYHALLKFRRNIHWRKHVKIPGNTLYLVVI